MNNNIWKQRLGDLLKVKAGTMDPSKLGEHPYTVSEQDELKKLVQNIYAQGGTGIGQYDPEILFLRRLLRLGPQETLEGRAYPRTSETEESLYRSMLSGGGSSQFGLQ